MRMSQLHASFTMYDTAPPQVRRNIALPHTSLHLAPQTPSKLIMVYKFIDFDHDLFKSFRKQIYRTDKLKH